MRKKLVAGNWKMNGLSSSLEEVMAMTTTADRLDCDLVVIPPFTLIERACTASKGSKLLIGGQNCHAQKSGAFTGDVSADMLLDAGAKFVILGHSERRTEHGETDALVSAKAATAIQSGLVAIICVGETQDERDANQTLAVIERQLAGSVPDTATSANTVVAYEPVWAIGTGRVPTVAQIAEVHLAIHAALKKRFGDDGGSVSVLYGGSVKPSNAQSIFAIEYVDGALVGGASLKASDFSAIAEALNA
ncbi:triose-phosphate isomerase [Sinorhizobium meliloti]|nr:triose-phosphate isomerase [Sinorhizobium meliloti]MQV37437.1 triose-phosphate isomerase [Sinorhizobium meliloti]RVE78954.1 triose-phosphate isomerase [Sinorhizobium meliloti]RVG42648.1 triose-phosphate isomerase [Sinorhizobium meliloti]RVM08264.1 triose-phosphate isomerase [Sinorhizobium meliloti]